MATPALGFDNFYTSTLSAGITASDTTIYLNALPTATEGYLVIEPDSSTAREIIYYTSKGANFVTLPSAAAGRGVGATTAQSHSSGVTVQMNVVAEHFEALQDGTSIAASAITASKIASLAVNTTAISNPYKFSVYRNAAQNLSAGVGTKINYDSELFDTNNNFDSTTNFRYTAPVAGFYQINMVCQVNATTGDIFYPYILKNGTTQIIRGARRNAASTLFGLGLSGIIQLAASDYIEGFMYNSGATTPALEVATIYTNAFNGYLISQT